MKIKRSSRYSHVADWQSARQPDREKTLQEEPISPVEVQQPIKQADRKKEGARDSFYAGKKKRSRDEEEEKEMQAEIKMCTEQSTRGHAYSNTGQIAKQGDDCKVIDLKA